MSAMNMRASHDTTFEFVQRCGNEFLEFVPASNAAVYVVDESMRPMACFAMRKTPAFQAEAYLQRYWKKDPLLPSSQSYQAERVRTLKKTASDSQCSDFINFIRRENCVDALKADLFLGGRIVGGVAMGRQTDEAPFSEGEIELLRKCSVLAQVADTYGQGRKLDVSHKIQQYRLTNRETDILTLLKEGASNKEIALHFDIGLATVKSHLIKMFEKVGVNSRTALLSTIYF